MLLPIIDQVAENEIWGFCNEDASHARPVTFFRSSEYEEALFIHRLNKSEVAERLIEQHKYNSAYDEINPMFYPPEAMLLVRSMEFPDLNYATAEVEPLGLSEGGTLLWVEAKLIPIPRISTNPLLAQ